MTLPTPSFLRLSAVVCVCTLFAIATPQSLVAQTLVGPTAPRLSSAGPDGDTNYDATHDGLAFNPVDGTYLVVWDADDRIPGTGATFNGKREVFGRLLDGLGQPTTGHLLLATRGPANDPSWDAENPEVVYNAARNEFLLTFVGTVASNGTASKREVFVQRIGDDGALIGGARRVSQTGSDGNLRLDSREPSLAHNTTTGESLVVWQRDLSDTGTRRESEIYAQRLGDDATPLGPSFRVSTMGPNGDTAYDALDPYVAYGAGRNEYLVVWRGDDNRAPLVQGEFEIFGQRLSAGGAEVGADDFRISEMGSRRDTRFSASDPAAAYNPDRGEFLVTWTGLHDLTQGEEVFAQLLSEDGGQLGADFRVSSMGPEGAPTTDYRVDETLAVYNPMDREYLVLWIGDDNRDLQALGEYEVFVQRLSPQGVQLGLDDFRVSRLGAIADPSYDPFSIDLAFNSVRGEYFVVYSGDDNRNSLVDDEVEIFGQRIDPAITACQDSGQTICLNGNRFEVTATWKTRQGTSGRGQARRLSSDSAWFWFFDDANTELVVKVLDARGVNGNFWVFYGALSDVEYALTVTDRQTGRQKEYFNPLGSFASRGDTGAFAGSKPHLDLERSYSAERAGPAGTSSPTESSASAACRSHASALCLAGSRFEVTVAWKDPFGNTGVGNARALTSDTGWFWFFDPANTELVVKVLDARGVNGKFWVFFGALSNVEYTVTVTDTQTGQVRRYTNPQGVFASVGDTDAF